MVRRPAGSQTQVQFLVDMAELNDIIGAVLATENLDTGSNYMQANIRTAFNFAEKEFNREVTSTAAASGKYAHMFEWGTVGINTAKTNMRPKADSETARLWTNQMAQTTKNNVISFQYKNSVAIVPKPNMKKAGIPNSIANKLSDHVFWNKAKVMESGQTVTVSRINSPKLFIPLVYLGPGYKGDYAMVNGPTNPTPGQSEHFRSHAGTFTMRFQSFWNGRGSEIMNEMAGRLLEEDLERTINDIQSRPPGRWTPPNKVDDKGRIERSKRTVTRLLTLAAEKREAESSG